MLVETSVTVPKLRVFKTITIGGRSCKTEDYISLMRRRGVRIGDKASKFFGGLRLTVTDKESDFSLVLPSVGDLGFAKRGERRKIYDRAIERGMKLCPLEAVFRLRLDYTDQPLSDWFIVATEHVAIRDSLFLFVLGRDGRGPWINTCSGSPDFCWTRGIRFAFVDPRHK